MAVHKISVKQVLSRVRQVFPDIPENSLAKKVLKQEHKLYPAAIKKLFN